MSWTESAWKQSGPACLVVPNVDNGDLGLVLTVCAVEWDGGYRRWSLTAANGNRYILPGDLHDWARRLDGDARRQLVNWPSVFAFSRQPGGVAARILSAPQSV